MESSDLSSANKRVVKRLAFVVLAMFGFGFALVPLYDVFCEFRPMTRKVKVHPGEITQVKYLARNRTGHTTAGQAVPSLAPGLAARYFNKTECFCFTRQTLGPDESREMPLRFVVDPGLPEEVRTVSLSYTFFQVPSDGSGKKGEMII
jgi:cytochrome c oxidase assembly protein subunit 11